MDYLFNLDNKALKKGRFSSHYWTQLLGLLEKEETKSNWLHHFIPHEAVASPRQAKTLTEKLNKSGGKKQFHFCLESAINRFVIWGAILDYLRIVLMNIRLTQMKHCFCPADSDLDFWPLFKNDWYNTHHCPPGAL